MPSPRLLSAAARVLITVFTASAVFEELGLADSTMLLPLPSCMGAVMLGLAIAFGLGGQELARRFLEGPLRPGKKEGKEREDELSPLYGVRNCERTCLRKTHFTRLWEGHDLGRANQYRKAYCALAPEVHLSS
jgi:hypothetical protein